MYERNMRHALQNKDAQIRTRPSEANSNLSRALVCLVLCLILLLPSGGSRTACTSLKRRSRGSDAWGSVRASFRTRHNPI